MKTGKRVYLQIAIWGLIAVSTAFAGNNIALVRTTANALEVQLANTEEIFGVQFSLRTSSNIVLGELERGIRTAESHWLVASYKPNDSTMNVLILSMERRNLPNGKGPLARIPFTRNEENEGSYALLSNVMVTNSRADSLGIAVNNLNWNNSSSLLADNGEIKTFQLGQNFPNPFNPTTRIVYRLNKDAQVKLCVYDITGREVKRLVDRQQGAGEYDVEWSSNSENGQKLASGMYIARLSVDNESVSRKMILTK